MKIIVIVISLLFTLNCYSQTPQAIEKHLLHLFKRIDYWTEYKDKKEEYIKYDSLEQANKTFKQALLKYTASNASTLTTSFKQLEDLGLSIATSRDGLLRIYSWDTYLGGTMHVFDNVVQYKNIGKVRSQSLSEALESGDGGFWCSSIYSLQYNHKTYYIAAEHSVFATLQCYDQLQAFCITPKGLNDSLTLFKTTTGLHNKLGYEYNIGMMENRTKDLINWNSQSMTLTIPVVYEDGYVTNKNIAYRFINGYFVKK